MRVRRRRGERSANRLVVIIYIHVNDSSLWKWHRRKLGCVTYQKWEYENRLGFSGTEDVRVCMRFIGYWLVVC